MLDKKHKLLELRTSTLVDSLFVWNYKTKLKWKWIEFIDYKEYDFSDNVKNIDFLRSEKEWKILVKLYEEERDLSVYFIIDLNETFFSDIFNHKKIDIVYELVYLIWFSAIKQWDKVWAFIFDSENNKFNFARKWKQNFVNIIQNLDKFDNFIKDWEKINYIKNIKDIFIFNKWFNILQNIKKNIKNDNKGIKNDNKGIKNIKNDINNYDNKNNININIKNNWLKYFNSLKIKNSLVFLITDKLDFDDKDLRVLWIKNDLIFCNIFNSFENNLNIDWIVGFNKWLKNIFLDLDDKNKVEEYINLRENKISNLKKKITKIWWKYVLLDETTKTFKELSKLFRK